MLKRILGWMLAALLVIGGVHAGLAQDAQLLDEVYVSAMARLDETLYLLGSDGIYTYGAQDEAPVKWGAVDNEVWTTGGGGITFSSGSGQDQDFQIPSISQLFAFKGALYGLDLSGEVYRLSQDGSGGVNLEKAVTLEWNDMTMVISGYELNRGIGNLFVQGDTLYLSRQNDDYISYDLAAYDLLTGKEIKVNLRSFYMITSYTQGYGLAAVADDAGMLSLFEVDLSTGDMTLLMPLEITTLSGLSYLESTGEAAFFSQGQVFVLTTQEGLRTAAYVPLNSADRLYGGWAYENLYVVCGEQGVYLRDTTPGKELTQPLVISGNVDSELIRAFNKAYPDIPLVVQDAYWTSGEDLTRHMAGATADIYTLNADWVDLKSLMKKGYAAPLSQSTTLMESTDSMYDFVKDAVKLDGELYAYPQTLNGTCIGYDPKALELLGLTEDDLPQTMAELIDFISRWDSDYQDLAPTLKLFNGEMTSPQAYFMDLLLGMASAQNIPTSALTEPIAAVLGGDYGAISAPNIQAESGVTIMVITAGEEVAPESLFTFYDTPVLATYEMYDSYKPLTLSVADGYEKVILTQLSVFVVNPYASNHQAALTFLAFYAASMNQVDKLNMYPDEQEPYENPYYEESLQQLQLLLDQAKQALEEADPADVKTAQEQVDTWEGYLAQSENERYWINAQDIAAYRGRAQYFKLAAYEQVTDELSSLIQRLFDGQLNVDQFINNYDQILRMIELEAQ